MANQKPNNVVRIPCTLDSFFRYWFMFLEPFHKLTPREQEVIACFVKHRYQLSKVIKDPEILEKVVMSDDTKKKVREECQVNLPYFQVIMGKLRSNNIIVDNKINPKFLPNLEGEDTFQLLLLFDMK